MVRTLTAAQELAEFSRQPRSPKEALISVNLGAFAMGHDINRPETELSPPIVPAGLHEFIIGNQAPSPDITDFIATLPPDARRMIDQGGVRLNGEKLSDKGLLLRAGETVVLQVGKRKFARVSLG